MKLALAGFRAGKTARPLHVGEWEIDGLYQLGARRTILNFDHDSAIF